MKTPRHQGKYDLVVGTPPEDLTQVELAALMTLPTFLTELSNLPGFDPTDVTVQLSWKSTGHVGCAKLEKKRPLPDPGECPVRGCALEYPHLHSDSPESTE